MRFLSLTLLGTLIFISPVSGESLENTPEEVSSSPKKGWGDLTLIEEEGPLPWYTQALLFIPNRLLDLVDVVKVDVGVGNALGAVVRVTKWGQAGYRSVAPLSLRVGLFGRDYPIRVERSSEFGVGPWFAQSHDREVCPGEVGVGADLLLVGAYGGVCVDELFDFFAGFLLFDPGRDDLD